MLYYYYKHIYIYIYYLISITNILKNIYTYIYMKSFSLVDCY